MLKWRSFNDDGLRRAVGAAFLQRGIAPERLELRGPSFHVDLLREYADIMSATRTATSSPWWVCRMLGWRG